MGPSQHQVRSSDFSVAGQPGFLIGWNHPSVPREDADHLLRQLERSAESGEQYKDGDTIQIGWIKARFRINSEGLLALEEPDFKNMPIRWVAGADRCLRDLRRQRDLVDSFDPPLQSSFPSAAQAARVCARYASGGAVMIERGQPDKNFSGWYFTCDDETDPHDVEDLRLVSLYEVGLRCPD
jgi:hypothetical protein